MAVKKDFVINYGLQTDKTGSNINTLVVDSINDRVGVGITNPASKLHVSGGDLYVNSLDGTDVDIKLGVHGSTANFSIVRSVRVSDSQSLLSFNISNGGLKEVAQLHYDEGLSVKGVGDGTTAGSAGLITFSDQSQTPLAQIISHKSTGVSNEAELIFSTNDGGECIEKLRITAFGNVGIGTNDPRTKLEVSGGLLANEVGVDLGTISDNAVPGLIIYGAGTFPSTTFVFGAAGNYNRPGRSGVFTGAYIDTENDTPISIATDGTERLSIEANGNIIIHNNVGIGITDPQTKLHVQGGVYISESLGIGVTNSTSLIETAKDWGSVISTHASFTATSYADSSRFVLTRANGTSSAPTSILNGDELGNFNFRGHDGTAFSTSGLANVAAYAEENYTTGSRSTKLRFGTTNVNETALTARMHLTGAGELLIGTSAKTGVTSQLLQVSGGAYFSGNVGIGSTAPGVALAVAGTIQAGTTTVFSTVGQDGGRSIEVGAGATTLDTYIDFGGSATYTDYAARVHRIAGDNGNFNLINRGTGNIRIVTQDAGLIDFLTTNTFRHRITSDGIFLVGGATSATGTAPLQVTGNGYFSGSVGVGTTNPTAPLHVIGNAIITGTTTLLSSGLVIRNPANTFSNIIAGSAITANRVFTLPLVTADSTLAVLSLAQTWTGGTQTFEGNVTVSGSTFNHTATTGNFSAAAGATTATVTIGGVSQTGGITIGQATTTQTLNLATGVSASGATKTINVGTGGASGSTTTITIGSATAGSTANTVINGGGTSPALSVVQTTALAGRWIIKANTTGIANDSGVYQDTTNNLSLAARDGSSVLRISLDSNASSVSYINAGNVGIGTTNPTSKLAVSGYITENPGDGVYWNVVTQKDVGYSANQVPLNQYLGQLAFLDAYSPSGLRSTGGGSDDVVVSSTGLVGIGTASPTSTLDVNSDTVRLRTSRTPASATATGTQGEICWDASYVYVCTATNTWRRASLASW